MDRLEIFQKDVAAADGEEMVLAPLVDVFINALTI